MIINSFFDKNNTIVFNSKKNTAKDPVTELFYGGEYKKYSRFIFKIDLSRLEELIDKGYFSDISKFKHVLKLTNTGFFDWDLAGNDFVGKNRTSSFDLGLYPLTQYWDQGVGYDEQINGLTHGTAVYSELPSNWYSATTINTWDVEGTHSGNTFLAIQHFELGNENLELDITDYINDILSGNSINYGLGLRFLDEYEELEMSKPQYVGFFTNKSDTAYEPYLQTTYNDLITDDRLNFMLNKTNRLYFYSYIGGELTDLDNIPSVEIFDSNDVLLETFDSSEVKHYGKGVYYIELSISSSNQDNCTMYYDVWNDLNYNGQSLPSFELDFTIREEKIQFGMSPKLTSQTAISLIGINNGERLNKGDLRDVFILPKIKYSNNQYDQNLSVYYRLYMKEGNSEITFFDYTETNTLYNGEKSFKLDTMSLLPGTYFLDVKWVKNGNIRIEKEIISFHIVSETEYRISQ